mgnify:CR=1 FL=1
MVGESGSGQVRARLLDASAWSIRPGGSPAGSVRFDGRELVGLPGASEMRQLRGKRIAMIFQDPMMTLNPVLSIETQMMETVFAHESLRSGKAPEKSASRTSDLVGIASPSAG